MSLSSNSSTSADAVASTDRPAAVRRNCRYVPGDIMQTSGSRKPRPAACKMRRVTVGRRENAGRARRY